MDGQMAARSTLRLVACLPRRAPSRWERRARQPPFGGGSHRWMSGRGTPEFAQAGEVFGSEAQLLGGALGAVDHVPEGSVLRPILGVPAQMLARDAHAGVLAIEGVQVFQMA